MNEDDREVLLERLDALETRLRQLERAGLQAVSPVHDHSSAAEGGQSIDVNGQADAIVLDADGDTSISAPTDDRIDIEIGGADQIILRLAEMVFNEQGIDSDFRVEGVGQVYALFVEGSSGKVGIGTLSPLQKLQVNGRVYSANASAPSRSTMFQFFNGDTGGVADYGIGMGPTSTEGFLEYGSGTASNASFGHRFLINGVIIMELEGTGNVGIGTGAPSTRLDIDAGAMEFAEMTAPAAGAANTARLFCRDNGAGKSQLCVIFNTGAIQVLATQP